MRNKGRVGGSRRSADSIKLEFSMRSHSSNRFWNFAIDQCESEAWGGSRAQYRTRKWTHNWLLWMPFVHVDFVS